MCRNYLDPQRFYKSNANAAANKKNNPTSLYVVQVGTVCMAADPRAQYTRRERPSSIMNEVMKDAKIASYTLGKHRKMQQFQTIKQQKRRAPSCKQWAGIFQKKWKKVSCRMYQMMLGVCTLCFRLRTPIHSYRHTRIQ
jgi:hypothetical protein